jgi:diguanylate cyclase (GGDEF)-like protein/PAS domain S-box-containing protein
MPEAQLTGPTARPEDAPRITPGVACYAGFSVLLALYAGGALGIQPSPVVIDLGVLPVGFIGTWMAWRAAFSDRLPARSRAAWRFLAAGTLAYALGELFWLYYEVVVDADMAMTPADVPYLLYYPLIVLGLLRLARPLESAAQRVKHALDVLMVVITGSMISWCFIILPLLREGRDSVLERVVALAYPVGDLLLLFGMAVVAQRRIESAGAWVYRAIAVALACNLAADWQYSIVTLQRGEYVSGQWPDSFWILAHFSFGLAAWMQLRWIPEPPPPDEERPALRDFSLLPYVAAAAGYVLVLMMWRRDGDAGTMSGLLAGAAVLTTLVLTRQAITVRENVGLLAGQRAAERALRESEARFRSLVQNSSDVTLVVGADTGIRFQSPALTRIFGHPEASLIGSRLMHLVHPEDQDRVAAVFEDVSQPGFLGAVECRLRHLDGDWRWVDAMVTSLLHDPAVGGVVLNVRDVTERRALEAQLSHQAFHDPLTGLANRLLFRDRVQHALDRASRTDEPLAVLFLDLDGFKTVNDTLGHSIGDELLQAVAVRLKASVRASDTVARLGGDEFAVLIEDSVEAAYALAVANRIGVSLARPVQLSGKEVLVGASIGVVLRTESDSGDSMLRNADAAMYAAKSAGKGRIQLYQEAVHGAAVARLEMEGEMRRGLDAGEFFLVFQPIVELSTGRPVAVEAFARWNHPRLGVTLPADFVYLAEESGLIAEFGRWVMRVACTTAAGWPDQNGGPPPVAVNVSGRQIVSDRLSIDVADALQGCGLPPSRLILEFTEASSGQHEELRVKRLQHLHGQGVRFALDDFGTGYTSLQQLERYPLEWLKVDRALVSRIGGPPRETAILRAMVAMGNSLGLRVVAEGIETEAQRHAVSELGCELGQGYFFAEPMPAKRLAAWLAQRETR